MATLLFTIFTRIVDIFQEWATFEGNKVKEEGIRYKKLFYEANCQLSLMYLLPALILCCHCWTLIYDIYDVTISDLSFQEDRLGGQCKWHMIYDIWHIINDKCNVMFNDLSFQEDRLGGQGGSGGPYWWYQQDEIGWRLAEIRFYTIGLWLLENILSLDWNRIFRLIMMQRHFWTLFKRWSFSLLTKIGDNLQWNFCQPVPLPCHGHTPCLWVN